MTHHRCAFAMAIVASVVLAQTAPPPKSAPAARPTAAEPATSASSATQPEERKVVEVTKEDFLSLPKILSTSLSTFGVRLGMTRQEAIEALESFCSQCSIKTDSDTGEITVTVQDDDTPAVLIRSGEGGIVRVEWTQRMEKYLAGQSHKLLTPAVFSKDSALRLELLGHEDTVTQEVWDVDGSMGTITTAAFVYGNEGLRLTMTVIEVKSLHKTTTQPRVALMGPVRTR